MIKIKVCVNSTKDFSEKTLPIIIPSLIEAGINPEDIFVFEGGHYERLVIKKDTYTLIQTDNNTIDFTALIDIVENKLESDYWFYIHDTCKVGPQFKKLLYNIPESLPDKIALTPIYSMNIGLYKYQYLMKHRDRLLKIKNKDYSREGIQKSKMWGIHYEDYILHGLQDSTPNIYNLDISHKPVILNERNWYNTDVKRRTEYHANLDLYKSKSNFSGPKDWMVIDL